jgi:hypothetical protein
VQLEKMKKHASVIRVIAHTQVRNFAVLSFHSFCLNLVGTMFPYV